MSRADQINAYIARGGIVRLRADKDEWQNVVHAEPDPAVSAWTLVTFDDGTSRVLRGDGQDCYTLEYAPGPDFRRGQE